MSSFTTEEFEKVMRHALWIEEDANKAEVVARQQTGLIDGLRSGTAYGPIACGMRSGRSVELIGDIEDLKAKVKEKREKYYALTTTGQPVDEFFLKCENGQLVAEIPGTVDLTTLKYFKEKPFDGFGIPKNYKIPNDWFTKQEVLPILHKEGASHDELQVVDLVHRGFGFCAIQGPPGTGKTTILASLIEAMVDLGLRIGVVSNAHKAIEHVLDGWIDKRPKGLKVFQHKKTTMKDNNTVLEKSPGLESGPWVHFVVHKAVTMLEQTYDVLFVDEAGQLAMFDVSILANKAKYLILLGDDAQLPAIVQGEHSIHLNPAMSAIAWVKKYFPERSIALQQTHRLNTGLTKLIGTAYYPNIGLQAGTNKDSYIKEVTTSEKAVIWADIPAGRHRYTNPVSTSIIKEWVTALRSATVFVDGKSDAVPLDSIAVLAPFRWQVSKLKQELLPICPTLKIGTVDIMQGQSVQLVIFDLTVDDPLFMAELAEWLFEANRWNVALSRAKAGAIIVGSKDALFSCMPSTINGVKALGKVRTIASSIT